MGHTSELHMILVSAISPFSPLFCGNGGFVGTGAWTLAWAGVKLLYVIVRLVQESFIFLIHSCKKDQSVSLKKVECNKVLIVNY